MCGVEGRGASDRALGCIVKTPRIWSLQEQLFAEDPSRASTWENSSTHRSHHALRPRWTYPSLEKCLCWRLGDTRPISNLMISLPLPELC